MKGELYLSLEILKAENLTDPSGKGKVDPYCQIECGKHKEVTDECKETMDPVRPTRLAFVSLFRPTRKTLTKEIFRLSRRRCG